MRFGLWKGLANLQDLDWSLDLENAQAKKEVPWLQMTKTWL